MGLEADPGLLGCSRDQRQSEALALCQDSVEGSPSVLGDDEG